MPLFIVTEGDKELEEFVRNTVNASAGGHSIVIGRAGKIFWVKGKCNQTVDLLRGVLSFKTIHLKLYCRNVFMKQIEKKKPLCYLESKALSL